jgi:SAM-dependent methyltransferase
MNERTLDKMIQYIYSSSTWFKLTIICIIIVCIYLFNNENVNKEGFIQKEKFVIKYNDEKYDDFYASIYKKINFDILKNEYEVGSIVNSTQPTSSSLILDIGSGTGEHVNKFNKKGFNAIGLDKSQSMINIASEEYPDFEFINGDVINNMIFSPHSFTHITCFNYTLYEIDNKLAFFNSCYEWLKPGGFLIVHIVNKNNFTPEFNKADPLKIRSNTQLGNEANKANKINFEDITYKKLFNIEKNKNETEMTEIFKDSNNKVRKHIQKIQIPSKNEILNKAKQIGFIEDSIINLNAVNYNNEYLYILYKPE